MRVGINATCLNDRPSGAKQRFLGVYGALFERFPHTEFVIFEPLDCHVGAWFSSNANVLSRTTTVPSDGSRASKVISGWGYWRQESIKDSFDLFEVLHLPAMKPTTGKSILTIHDVRGLNNPSLANRTIFAVVLRRALSKADHVVTVSASMRDEIISFYPHTPVSVVYNGLDTAAFTQVTEADCKAFLVKYKLPGNFILAVGHFESRKNYSRLIEAMTLLKQRGVDCPLVIVGNDSGSSVSLSKQIEELGLLGHVFLLFVGPDG